MNVNRLMQERQYMRAKIKRMKQLHMLERLIFCACILLLVFSFLRAKIQLEEASVRLSAAQETPSPADVVSLEKNAASGNESFIPIDYPSLCQAKSVDAPLHREYDAVLEKLAQLSKEYVLIAEILKQPRLYPEPLLEALANNPEMADFVSGWPSAKKTAKGGLTEAEKSQDFPLFLQWDPRWGYACYGDNSSIAVSGCGPTSLSMVLYYLTGDESLTPDRLADYSMENGYYVSGTGTAWALMTDAAPLYGIDVTQPAIEEARMKQELNKGHILIASMKPGDFTATGHFVVIYGYDEQGFYINDPNCVARSRIPWSFEQLEHQLKNLWSFSN